MWYQVEVGGPSWSIFTRFLQHICQLTWFIPQTSVQRALQHHMIQNVPQTDWTADVQCEHSRLIHRCSTGLRMGSVHVTTISCATSYIMPTMLGIFSDIFCSLSNTNHHLLPAPRSHCYSLDWSLLPPIVTSLLYSCLFVSEPEPGLCIH